MTNQELVMELLKYPSDTKVCIDSQAHKLEKILISL